MKANPGDVVLFSGAGDLLHFFNGVVEEPGCRGLGNIGWLVYFQRTGIYEIIPGVFRGLLAAVLVSLLTEAPS